LCCPTKTASTQNALSRCRHTHTRTHAHTHTHTHTHRHTHTHMRTHAFTLTTCTVKHNFRPAMSYFACRHNVSCTFAHTLIITIYLLFCLLSYSCTTCSTRQPFLSTHKHQLPSQSLCLLLYSCTTCSTRQSFLSKPALVIIRSFLKKPAHVIIRLFHLKPALVTVPSLCFSSYSCTFVKCPHLPPCLLFVPCPMATVAQLAAPGNPSFPRTQAPIAITISLFFALQLHNLRHLATLVDSCLVRELWLKFKCTLGSCLTPFRECFH